MDLLEGLSREVNITIKSWNSDCIREILLSGIIRISQIQLFLVIPCVLVAILFSDVADLNRGNALTIDVILDWHNEDTNFVGSSWVDTVWNLISNDIVSPFGICRAPFFVVESDTPRVSSHDDFGFCTVGLSNCESRNDGISVSNIDSARVGISTNVR